MGHLTPIHTCSVVQIILSFLHDLLLIAIRYNLGSFVDETFG